MRYALNPETAEDWLYEAMWQYWCGNKDKVLYSLTQVCIQMEKESETTEKRKEKEVSDD